MLDSASVNSISSIPSPVYQCKKGLAPEHGSKLLSYTLPYLLNSGSITNESNSHLETLGRNVTNGSLDIIRNPFDEVRRVLIHNVKHLLINLLGRHSTPEHVGTSQVSTMSWISSAHHVLGIEGLLGELRNGKSSIL